MFVFCLHGASVVARLGAAWQHLRLLPHGLAKLLEYGTLRPESKGGRGQAPALTLESCIPIVQDSRAQKHSFRYLP